MAAKKEDKGGKDDKKAAPKAAPKAKDGGGGGEKKERKAKGEAASPAAGHLTAPEGYKSKAAAESVPTLKSRYLKEVVPALRKQFGYKNVMQVPRLQKIVVNMGLGEAVQTPKIIESAVAEMTLFTGQKPIVTRSKKAIANFKLRAGLAIGAMVTLRQDRMWEFLDRLIYLALPRVRDFKGVSPRAFDGRGNYSLGMKEQIVFPEIDYDKVDKIKGMNISFVTTAQTDEEGRALLAAFGMPFRQ
ncbi:MAG: 50S ribosomal protein L5 [Myxococcales bacterium]|nr:50S ribosomal protein L5 [Myxococcales bacterium]